MKALYMINRFLQFIKKQQLAVKLAKEDLLFLTEEMKTFKLVRPLASLFVHKKSVSKIRRIKRFLRDEDNPLLYVFAGEMSSLTDSPFEYLPFRKRRLCGDVLLKTTKNIKDNRFYTSLFSEIIKTDFPVWAKKWPDLSDNLDICKDMRLYGSELEYLSDLSAEYENCCRMDIDWIKTSRENLYVHFGRECLLTKKLPLEAQNNLSRLFAVLLLEKSVFVSLWNGILLSSDNEVGFLDFDGVYPADNRLKDYALAFIKNGRKPQTAEEWKLHRALLLLERYCPDIDCFSLWKGIRKVNVPDKEQKDNSEMLQKMRENGFDFGTSPQAQMTNPQDIAYLLKKKNIRKEKAYRKSGFLYWAPLLLAMFLLLKYF